MIALQHKETIQRPEAAVKCLKSKGFIISRHNNGSSVEGLSEPQDEPFALPSGKNVEVEPGPTFVSESAISAKEFHNSPPYSPVFGSCPSHHLYSKHMHCWQNQICPYPIDTRFHYARVGYFPQNYSYENQLQEFQYFVVIDFEATCEDGKIPNPQEIIEFPSVLVNGVTGQVVDHFQKYVRPTCNRNLSDFCKGLTGIQQTQVDEGVTLSEALVCHDKWLEHNGLKNGNFAVVTWSNWDCRVMLESECQYKKIRKPSYFNRWINLKIPFRRIMGGDRFITLKQAVEKAGLTWQGRPHSGLDDAMNTALLLSFLMSRGFKFTITSKLDGELLTNPVPPHQQPPLRHQQATSPPQHPMIFHVYPCCFCGVKSKQERFGKPGPMLGSLFFSCGNWTLARGNLCRFFQWAFY